MQSIVTKTECSEKEKRYLRKKVSGKGFLSYLENRISQIPHEQIQSRAAHKVLVRRRVHLRRMTITMTSSLRHHMSSIPSVRQSPTLWTRHPLHEHVRADTTNGFSALVSSDDVMKSKNYVIGVFFLYLLGFKCGGYRRCCRRRITCCTWYGKSHCKSQNLLYLFSSSICFV